MTNKELEVKVKAIKKDVDALASQQKTDGKSDSKNDDPIHQTQSRHRLEIREQLAFVFLAVALLAFLVAISGGFRFELEVGRFRFGTDQTQKVRPDHRPDPAPDPTPRPPEIEGVEEAAKRLAQTSVEKTETFEAEKKKLKDLYQKIASQCRSGQIKDLSQMRTAIRESVSQVADPSIGEQWFPFFEGIKTVLSRELGDTADMEKYADAYEQIAKGLDDV